LIYIYISTKIRKLLDISKNLFLYNYIEKINFYYYYFFMNIFIFFIYIFINNNNNKINLIIILDIKIILKLLNLFLLFKDIYILKYINLL